MTFHRIFLFIAYLPLCAFQLPAVDRAMEEKYGEKLREVVRFQEKISDLNPVFQTLCPPAIVEGKSFFIFQPNPEKREYRLVHTAPDPMNIPKGIRAAMPLGFWENRMVRFLEQQKSGLLNNWMDLFVAIASPDWSASR